MSTQTTTLRRRLRNALAVPFDPEASQQTRTTFALAILTGSLMSVAAIVGLFSWLFVGLPQTIVTGSFGQVCVTGTGIDCARAIADARQAVLLALGGILGVIGVIFTHLRWRAERDNTDEAIAEGTRATVRHEREGEQLEISRITDAIGLLDSTDEGKQRAAISLLTGYALKATDEHHVEVILDVFNAVIEADHRTGWGEVDDQTPHGRLTISSVAGAALRGLLVASSARQVSVELENLVFRGLKAPGSDWTYVTLINVTFTDCYLPRARFGRGPSEHTNVQFEMTDLHHADFSGSRFFGSSFYAQEPRSQGTSMYMTETNFTSAQLSDVEFRDAWLMQTAFHESTLRQVSFEGGSSVDAESFLGASLIQVHFGPGAAHEHQTLVSRRGSHPLSGIINPGVITDIGYINIQSDAAGPYSAREDGGARRDSPSPEPTSTDESPT